MQRTSTFSSSLMRPAAILALILSLSLTTGCLGADGEDDDMQQADTQAADTATDTNIDDTNADDTNLGDTQVDDTQVGDDTGPSPDAGNDTYEPDDTYEPPVPATLCEQMHSQAIGELVIVIDWQCPVSQRCGNDSVIADCGNSGIGDGGDWYCGCVDGYQMCRPIAPEGEGVCPERPADDDNDCLLAFGAEACGDGSFCEAAPDAEPAYEFSGDQWGTCQPLPALCSINACYDNADCGSYTQIHYLDARCHGADPLTGTAGECLPLPATPGDCSGAADCPNEWTCEGAPDACDDLCGCNDSPAYDAFGTCTKVSGYSTPALWLPDADSLEAGDTVTPYWTKGAIGESSDWFSCPAYAVEVRDELTYAWTTIYEDDCANGPDLVELAPGSLEALPSFTVPAVSDLGYTVFRLRASYYNGCEDAEYAYQCDGGPYERYSNRTYTVEPSAY